MNPEEVETAQRIKDAGSYDSFIEMDFSWEHDLLNLEDRIGIDLVNKRNTL